MVMIFIIGTRTLTFKEVVEVVCENNPENKHTIGHAKTPTFINQFLISSQIDLVFCRW